MDKQNTEWPANWVPEHLHGMMPYQPGKPISELRREHGLEQIVKIASNENPMGPSPKAIAAAKEAVETCSLYPDGAAFELRSALAGKLEVDPNQLMFGAGSNEVLSLIVQAVCRRSTDEVLTHKYAFLSYRLTTISHRAAFREVEVNEDLSCNVDNLLDAVTENTRVVFLANPNNPTGAHISISDYEKVVRELPEHVLLVSDEAYYEYAQGSPEFANSMNYHGERQQLVTLRTFSKAYGLAGLRVGYGIGDARLMDYVNRIRRPFNANYVAQAAAVAALEDQEFVARALKVNEQALSAYRTVLAECGVRVYPTMGNFLLVGVERDSMEVYEKLLSRGVIVRPLGGWGLPQHIRISACRPDEIDFVCEALRASLT